MANTGDDPNAMQLPNFDEITAALRSPRANSARTASANPPIVEVPVEVENVGDPKDNAEEENVDDDARVRHHCRPANVHKFAKHILSRKDKGKILPFFETTGFSGILEIANWTCGIPKTFVIWVIENFDRKSYSSS